MHKNKHRLNEGLRAKDLKEFVSNVFSVDRYTSKMGEDKDVVVLGFRVKEKLPALDLVEFIETGYKFVLDADMSSGEEHDGQYQVFVELERNEKLPGQIMNLLNGIGQLTDNKNWEFKYRNSKQYQVTDETLTEQIPLNSQSYQSKMLEQKTQDVQEFFDQGSVSVDLEENSIVKFNKPYSGELTAKLISLGQYDDVLHTLPGAISLDENSNAEILFLNKFLGNYDIHKIGDKFLIANGDRAVVLEKGKW